MQVCVPMQVCPHASTRVDTADSHEVILDCFQTRSAAACEKPTREHILSWREWLPMVELKT